jgi:adenylate cyclase
MSLKNAAQVAKLRAALEEILSRRNLFSHETYTQVVLSLYDRIRVLQSEIAAAEPEDEIRLVTVMFMDILDSTQIAHQVEAEVWKTIIDETYQRLGGIVRHWGGEVAQYLGDGILCFFGAHHSQEDDAVRAVSCALAAQDAMLAYAGDLMRDYRIRFAVRIGMSTGRVVVGKIGDKDKQEVLALGTPTNLAARLQVLAEPGRVLIDQQTYYRVRKAFITQAHPLARVKGFEIPVEYFTVVGKRRQTQLTTDRVAGLEIGFVGRAQEFRHLTEVLQRVLNEGIGLSVLIVGELGIGKSRLLQEVLMADHLPYQQIVIVGEYDRQYSLLRLLLAARCDLRDDTPPEIAEARILQHIFETWPHPDAEIAAHIIGSVTGYGFAHSPHTRMVQSETPESREVVYGWVARWFAALAGASPLLLVMDNLQWVDSHSLGLLDYLAAELTQVPVAILVAGRSGSITRAEQMHLSPLSDDEVSLMLESVFQHVDGLPSTVHEVIVGRAQGNPLFIEEFLLMLFDAEVFEKTDAGRWRVNPFQLASFAFDPPNNLLGLLQARLDDLPAQSRRAVLAVSVMGQVFWQGTLAALLGEEWAAVSPILVDLETRGFIVRAAESGLEDEREYHFRHTLYPEVAYLMLTRPLRESHHRDVAAWLAGRVATHQEYLGMLADQYQKGGQTQEALTTYLTAARDRFRRGLLRETLDMTERGLAVGRVPREIALPLVSQLWMLQGQVLEALDRYEESSAASQSALMLMDELPPLDMAEERVMAARTLGSAYLSLGRYDEAFRALNNAHSLLPKENVLQHASILRTFGTLCYVQGQLNESQTFAEQAMKLAQPDPREVARVTSLLSLVSLDRGAFAQALDYSEYVLDVNRQQGNLYYQVLDLRQIASIYRGVFAYQQSMALCEEADALEKRIRYQDPLLQTTRGLNWIALGQPEEGLRLLREAASIRYQNVHTRWRVQLALASGLGLIGAYDECRELTTALASATRDYNVVLYGRAQLWLGVAFAGAGSTQKAQSILREALEIERTYGGRDTWLCYDTLIQLGFDDYRQPLRKVFTTVGETLQTRPVLQAAFLQSDAVRQVVD